MCQVDAKQLQRIEPYVCYTIIVIYGLCLKILLLMFGEICCDIQNEDDKDHDIPRPASIASTKEKTISRVTQKVRAMDPR